MLKHKQALTRDSTNNNTPGRSTIDLRGSDAARSQQCGLAALQDFSASLSILSWSSSLTSITSNPQSSDSTESTLEPSETEILEAEKCAVDNELSTWISEGIITDREKLATFDLIRFWDNVRCDSIYYQFPSHLISLGIHSTEASNSVPPRTRCPSGSSIRCSLRESFLIKQRN